MLLRRQALQTASALLGAIAVPMARCLPMRRERRAQRDWG